VEWQLSAPDFLHLQDSRARGRTDPWSLLSDPHESRAPVAPTLAEWALRPQVSNRTLRGSHFSSLVLEPLEGHPYLVRDRAI
jgi:hypothetical protein